MTVSLEWAKKGKQKREGGGKKDNQLKDGVVVSSSVALETQFRFNSNRQDKMKSYKNCFLWWSNHASW